MSDRAETRVRAYPMPALDELADEVRELIADADGEVFTLDGVGRVLAIDSEEAADGIHSYDELIAALHGLGLNVFAENLDDDTAIVARREFWAAGGDVLRWLINPLTRERLIRLAELEAAVRDGADAQALLERFGEPELPDGLLDVADACEEQARRNETVAWLEEQGVVTTSAQRVYFEQTDDGLAADQALIAALEFSAAEEEAMGD